MMKCIVWNMDYWKSPQKEQGWEYLNSVDPDICLLNECSRHASQEFSTHNISRNDWGVGVFSKHELDELEFQKCHPDAIACGQITFGNRTITAISLYGKIIDKYAITTLHRSLSDLTHLFIRKELRDWMLIGGDFNADVAIDENQRGNSHHIFFERLKDFGFYDCIRKFHGERIQTLRHSNSSFPWQNDYLFAGKKLYECCVSSEVIDDERLYEISDHNPLVAEFDIS